MPNLVEGTSKSESSNKLANFFNFRNIEQICYYEENISLRKILIKYFIELHFYAIFLLFCFLFNVLAERGKCFY